MTIDVKIMKRISGCLWGLAIGDALGFPVEFMTPEEIKKRFGPLGVIRMEHQGNFPRGTYSDDTQMTLAVADALIESKTDSTEEIMPNISHKFISWARSPENDRSPGSTCMAGIRNLQRGKDWKSSGIMGGDGCGAAMRSAPIGIVFYNQPEKLKEIASASAIITHDSNVAIASAVANAYLVSQGILGEDPSKGLERVISFTNGISERFTRKMKQVYDVQHLNPQEAVRALGNGFKADEAVALAMYHAIKDSFDFEKTVLSASNAGGDADSVASIAGGIIGAYKGEDAIPREYLKPLENRELLYETADKLYDRSVKQLLL